MITKGKKIISEINLRPIDDRIYGMTKIGNQIVLIEVPSVDELTDLLENKLEISNLIAGENINLTISGKDVTISAIGGGSGTTNHALLSNLGYDVSGHIGFASLDDIDGLQSQIDEIIRILTWS